MFQNILIWSKKNYPLIIGLVIALVLSYTAAHTDLTTLSLVAKRVASGNFDIYTNYRAGKMTLGPPLMPPLILLLDGLIYFILKTIGIFRFNFEVYASSFPWQVFALKLRYLIVFILSYPLVKKVGLALTKNEKKANTIAAIWITSPILLYLTFTQGNNDIYPVVFTLIFLFFAFKEKNYLAMIFLGLAAAMKNYGVFLFLPTAIILAEKDIKKLTKYLLAAGTAFVIPNLLYYRHFLNFGQGGGEGLLMLTTKISSQVNFLVFPILYFLVIIYLYFGDNLESLKENKNRNLVLYSFLVMALFYLLSFFIPQWFLWILPFFVLLVFENKRLFLINILINMVFLVSLFTNWQNNLDLKIFSSILPIEVRVNGIYPNFSTTLLPTLIYSLFSALFIAFVYFLIRGQEDKNDKKIGTNYVFYNLSPLILTLVILIGSFSINSYKLERGKGVYNAIQSKISNNQNVLFYGSELVNTEFDPAQIGIPEQEVVLAVPKIKVDPDSQLYAVLTYEDVTEDNPSVFIKSQGEELKAESRSIQNFRSYNGKVYYAKIAPEALSNAENFRIRIKEITKFKIKSFQVVDLKE